jgi:hypothetical protein
MSAMYYLAALLVSALGAAIVGIMTAVAINMARYTLVASGELRYEMANSLDDSR